ncbi:hypothetical protein HDU97_008776 [Phlyctochytrium planicorne]|nr:hypothetical protein HDU97_008776 [Phlyctochytrium planicorne]
MPASSDSVALANWMATFASGLAAIERAGAEFLLIDVSNNPGGIVCAGEAFAQYLLPTTRYVSYDIRRTKPVQSLLNYAITNSDIVTNTSTFSVSDLRTSPGRRPFQNDDLLSKGPVYSRGRTLSSYTSKFETDCSEYNVNIFKNLPQPAVGWRAEKIAFLSNGFCGSTCANFLRVFREQYNVRTFVYGGASGKPFQPTTFEGGRVVTFDEILLDSNEILWNAAMANGTVIRGLHRPNSTSTGQVQRRNEDLLDAISNSGKASKKATPKAKGAAKPAKADKVTKAKHDKVNGVKGSTTASKKQKSSGKASKLDQYVLNNAKIVESMVPIRDSSFDDSKTEFKGSTDTVALNGSPDSVSDANKSKASAAAFAAADVLANLPNFPREFPRPVLGSLTFWESYAVFGPVTAVPLEWVRAPAEELVQVADPLKVEDIWKEVSKRLQSSPPPAPPSFKQKNERIGGEMSDNSRKSNGAMQLSVLRSLPILSLSFVIVYIF